MSNKNCTYTFTNGQGQKQTIMGLSSMKAFLVDGGLDLFYPSGKFPWLSTESAIDIIQPGPVERRPQRIGSSRYSRVSVIPGINTQADANAQDKVVAYLNGDISRTTLMDYLSASGLPEEKIIAFTQRMQDDGPSMGEIKAMLAQRDDLDAMFDDVLAEEMAKDEAAKPAPQSKPKASKPRSTTPKPRSTAAKPTRTAGQAAASAAKNTASALANAIDGLGALFGGGGKFNSGLSFDEETYAKAKPLFQAAIANLGEAGQDLREAMRAVVRMVLDKFGAQAAQNMKPYVVRFVSDVQNGNITGESNDESQVRRDGDEALEDVAPEQGGGAQGGGRVRGGDSGGSDSGDQSGRGADADGVSTTRGGRGRSKGVRASGAGAGGRGRRGSDRAGEAGPRVQRDDAGAAGNSGQGGSAGLIEPPAIPATNYRISADTRLGVGSEIEKFNDNIEAIKTLKRIEAERRRATPDEQRILARYVGWGGLASAFPNPATGQFKDKWQERGELLRSLLTKQEYDKASNSTIAAHFTSETVVRSMWDIAKRLGFKGGLALEDSMGVGNFVGLMPEGLDARFIGVELDSLTARIAQALYPQATVLNSGFEQVPIADNAFALNIGNPPFSKVSLNFQFKPELAGVSMHNQFFRAGMDALRPGGLQIKVVSRYLMDAEDKSTRLALAAKARLVGLIRLPDTAFQENARTEVVTDIVILQKLSLAEQAEMDLAIEAYKSRGDKNGNKTPEQQMLASRVPAWVETTLVPDPLGGEPMRVNSYLARNPRNIMGTLERSGSMQFKNDVTVRLDNPQRLGDMLAEAVARLPMNIHSLEAEVMAATEERFKSMSDALRIALANEEIGHLKVDEDGKLQRVIERETPEGGYEMQRQELTPQSPWSSQLYLDAQGRWYRLVPKLDADGKTVKEPGKDGKPSSRNVYEREVFSEQDVPDGLRLGAMAYARLRGMVGLRDLLKAQLVMETEDADPQDMEANRAKLAQAYEQFVAEFGPVNRSVNLNLAMTMPDGGLVAALEVSYQPERTENQAKKSGLPAQEEVATPAPVMRERVVPKYEPATTANSGADALAIVLSETGRVDVERIAALRGVSVEDAVAELQSGDAPLVFKDPESGQYETADNYLSGMVKRKLKAAEAAGMALNVRALQAVQPEPWTAENVTVSLGANWVPVDVYADFINHLTGGQARVNYSSATNAFGVTNRGEDRAKHEDWSTEGAPVEYLIQQALNSRSATVTYKDSNGDTKIDTAATDLANLKIKEIKSEFADWVFADAARRERLVAINNELFNTRVTRQHNGQHLKLPGKVPDAILKMRRHQLNAIWRGIYERFMLIDHAVGAGKTFTGIARAMERRRMGLSKKPMIVVPNHLVEQWAADVYRLYPGAKVLAAGKKDFEVKNRRRLLGKIATGDWDIVIMPHSSFGGIGIAPETERRYLEEELQLAMQAVQDAERQAVEDGTSGWRKPYTVKMAEALVTKIQARMDRISSGVRDRLLTFEQLGVDDLTVDEAHEFKNLYYSSNLSKVRGMGDRGGSRKANDLYNKVRVLRSSPTGSVTFMTGTPISNSAVEMYTMMRYLAGDSLKEMGLENFDAWRTQFVEHTTAFEPTETGRLKEVSRLGRTWSNMRGLMELYYQFTDAVSLQDIQRWYSEDNGGKPFPVPKLKGGDRQLVKIKPTPTQNQFLSDIIDGFDGLPSIEDPNERNAERLRLMDRARKVSLDVRAIDPTNPSKEEGGKLDVASQNIKRIYDKFNNVRGTQLVFLDRSVPKSKGDDKLLKEYDALVAKREEALARDDEDAFAKVAEALEKFDSDEMESLRAAQAGGWNAYQQLKDNLVAMGIPANEIRFIQEADTDDKKLALFDAVNGGKVRVLIGSTPRMGAGTNVQKRAVALHHIDVTWKPSDIEQREGRVIRQGNLFATPPSGKEPNPFYRPDFEVEILAYATERTVDAKMWDLNATKLKTINGIRKYDGSFTMDFEDSDSVSMAEMAALASGNPLLLERVKLESEIGTLELQERAHRRKMYGAEDALGRAEDAIRNHPERINRERAKVEAAAKRVQGLQERVNARSVNVEGATYSDRYAAAKAVKESIERQQNGDENARFAVSINGKRYSGKDSTLEAVDAALGDVQPFEMTVGDKLLIQRTAAGREVAAALGQATAGMTGELTTELKLGDVLGLSLVAGVRRYLTQDGNPMLDVDISALDAIGNTIASEQLPSQASGIIFNTTTVKNSLDRLFDSMVADSSDRRLNNLVRELQDAKDNLATYREKASEPFPGAQEIQAKRARLADVVQLLDGSNAPVQEPAAPAPIVQRWNPGEPRFMQPAFSRGSARTSAGVNWQPAADQSAAKIVAAGMRADQRNKPGNYDYTIVEPAKTRLGLGNLAGDRAQGLTDALYRRVRDFEAAFGRRVVFVRADNGSPDGFSGFIMPKSDPDTIYVNINADINLMSILGHEFYEGLVVKNPQLHSWFLNQAARQLKDGALKSYSERLARAGDKQRHGLGRFKEMLADFAGDALADPEFRRSLEKADPSKFRALIRSFREFLIRLLSKMRGRIVGTGIMGERTLQANQHFKDVQALRDALRDVIRKADSGGNLQQFLADGGALFSRSQDQTQTEAFKRWFGDSKVVGADGRPLRVYHGSPSADITAFDARKEGANTGAADVDHGLGGFYFTTDPNISDTYARTHEVEFANIAEQELGLLPSGALPNSTIYPAFLSIKNPLMVKGGAITQAVIDRARNGGHDGIIKGGSYPEYVAFRPEQIKSATGNNGDFDPANPDIRFSRAVPPLDDDGVSRMQSGAATQPETLDVVVDRGNPYTELISNPLSRQAIGKKGGDFLRFFGDLLVLEGVKPSVNEGFGESLVRNSERLRSFYGTHAGAKKTYGSLDIPSKRFVMESVGNAINNLQVLRSIVESIPVDVMDFLAMKYGPTDGDAGNVPVLLNGLPVDADVAVSAAIDVAASVVSDVATAQRAKNSPGIWDMAGKSLNSSPANGAGAGNFRHGSGLSGEASAPSGAWSNSTPSVFDYIVYKLQDRLIDTKRVQAAITKTAGEIEDDINAYQREELYHGRAAKRAQDFLTQELNPMVEQLAKDKIELADFEEYLHARHAPEANRVLAERNPNQAMIDAGLEAATQEIEEVELELAATTDPAEIKLLSRRMREAQAELSKWSSVQPFRGTEEDRLRLSGMSDDQARAIMDALTPEQRAKLDAAAAQFDAIVAQNRQLMVDYDLEDQETIDSWSQLFQHYVPLMREDEGDGVQQGMGTGQGFSIKGREVKSRTGSTRKVVDIVANVAMQRERIITRGEKNRVSQALMGLAALNPNPDFWKLGAPDKKRQYDPATNTVKVVTDPQYKNRENVVVAKVRNSKGRVTEVALTFNERDARAVRMAAAIKNLEDSQLGTVMSWTAKITRYMASINTQYNPIFGVVNLVRDLQGAVVNLAGTPLANSKGRVVKNAVLALADIYLGARQERKGTERQTQWGRLWQEFQEVGGMTGFRDQFRNSGDRARAIERTMNPEKWMESAFGKVVAAGGLLKTPMTWVQDGGGWVLDLLSDYNLAMENGVRLAAYKEGLDKGLTQEQAASLAKNITVNFNRRGSIGLHVGSAYAFFNAAMQGTARMGQAMTTMEDGKLSTLRLSALGKQVVAGGLAMGVAQAVALSMAGFGEDEPPQFVREKNLIIPTGWTGIGSEKGYLTVPMPLGLHVIPGLGRHLTEFAMSGGKNPAERVTLIMGMLLDAFNPIGNAGWSLQTIVPTVLDPLAALAENKDYTGRNIAIESRNPNAPGHTLARDTASTFSKLLSEAINTLTGGNEYVSGVMSPTPDQIDYLIGQVTGGVGREALKVEQTVRGAVTGEEVPLYKIPLVGRFAGDSDGSGGQATIYRANVNRLDRAQMEIDGLRKDGRFQESEALRQRSNPYLLAQARAAESQVQRLRRMKRDMVEKGASRESVREVERKISEAMGRLNRAVEAQQR